MKFLNLFLSLFLLLSLYFPADFSDISLPRYLVDTLFMTLLVLSRKYILFPREGVNLDMEISQ